MSPRRQPGSMRELVAVLAGATTLMVGYGLAFAYVSLFLDERTGTGGVVTWFAASGAAGIVAGFVLSSPAVVIAERTGIAVALLAGAVAFMLLPLVNDVITVALLAAITGVAQALFQASLMPLLFRLATPAQHRAVFAVRYQTANIALAAGVVLTGWLLSARGVEGASIVFIGTALLHLPLLVVMRWIRPEASRQSVSIDAEETDDPARVGGRSLLRLTGAVLIFQTGAGLLVFPHLESTAPLAVSRDLGGPGTWVTIVVLSNLVAVLAFQVPVTRVLQRWPPWTGLRLAAGIWVVSYLAAAVLLTSAGTQLVGLVVLAVGTGVGECAYACSFHPALLAAVPSRATTQASSLANTAGSVGTLLGPVIGVSVLEVTDASTIWVILGVAMAPLVFLRPRRLLGSVPAPERPFGVSS